MNMKKILVVEDDKQLGAMIQKSLTGHGYIVSLAGDGLEALEIALKEPPDLIIADIAMPRMDGPTFISELWERMNNHRIPVIYLTGLISKAEEEMQRDLLGNHFMLAKPFAPSALKSLVGQVLR